VGGGWWVWMVLRWSDGGWNRFLSFALSASNQFNRLDRVRRNVCLSVSFDPGIASSPSNRPVKSSRSQNPKSRRKVKKENEN